jgi:predicted DNA-binding transcriptional regulator AlpA
MNDTTLLTPNDIVRDYKISHRTLRRIADGVRFPKPLKIGAARRWRRHEVESFLDSVTQAQVLQEHK